MSELLVRGDPSYAKVTADIAAPLERRAGAGWWVMFGM